MGDEINERRRKRIKRAGTDIVRLNVGGRVFTTLKETLKAVPNTLLASMFSGDFIPGAQDQDGCWFLDRNPEHFAHILEYLRAQIMPVPSAGLIAEARYFGLTELATELSPPEKAKKDSSKEYRVISFKNSRYIGMPCNSRCRSQNSVAGECQGATRTDALTGVLYDIRGQIPLQHRKVVDDMINKLNLEQWILFAVNKDPSVDRYDFSFQRQRPLPSPAQS